MTHELVLGIDFGSSSTIAGVLINDRIELVQDAGDSVIPSVVYIPDKGETLVGRRAVARQIGEPSNVIRSVKRLLGLSSTDELVRRYAASTPLKLELSTPKPMFKLRSGPQAPEQVAASIIGYVRGLAEQRFGTRISKAVMTMSAGAPPKYREALIRAARIAHLELLDTIAEPVAASLALDLHTQNIDRNIVVADFGGGTFDVSAVEQRGLRFTPVAIGGDHWLGGDDLDDSLASAVGGVIYKRSKFDISTDKTKWTELVMRCESAKRQLSTNTETPLHMREAYTHEGARTDLRVSIDRPYAERAWASQMERVKGVIERLLAKCNWTADDVHVCGLVGGGALIPIFRQTCADVFGADKLIRADQPELAVAQGATVLTARYRAMQTGKLPVLVA
ncbi:MAG TPA: Hsp70 family protein [Kofleriaceae bacterium]|jgi:molecular chaperone DnaK (HSP70)